jgi:hypothetical protein
MAYIGNPPAKFIIPVTIGTDREFTLNRNDGTPQKAPVDWAATVSMAIDIDKASPTVIPATVTGNQAVIVIPSATADLVKDKTTRWRISMTTGGLTTAIAVGSFERDDGGS